MKNDDLQSLRRNVKDMRRRLDNSIGHREALEQERTSEKQKVQALEKEHELYGEARDFLRDVLEGTQAAIEKTFSEITTAGIAGIFGEEHALQFEFVPTANGVSVNIHVLKPAPGAGDQLVKINPENTEGGGLKDIISLGLRAGLLELYIPKQDGPLILDEVCKHIADDDTLQNTGEFIRNLQEQSGRQIIIVTHKEGLSAFADKLFKFNPGPDETVEIESL